MGWLEDVVESMPAEYEEAARMYIPALQRMPKEEVLEWLDYLRKNQENAAYAALAKRMETDEIVADGDRGNDLLRLLNKDRAEKVNMGWHLVYVLVSVALNKRMQE